MITRSLHALLEQLIDYAGLFPPAALTMQDAVRNYARYRDGEYAWALGRFVVPQARASEVPEEFPVSILGVDEVKATTEEEIAAFPPGVYVEIADLALLDAIRRHGLRAKIRTGGITADAFPADRERRGVSPCVQGEGRRVQGDGRAAPSAAVREAADV